MYEFDVPLDTVFARAFVVAEGAFEGLGPRVREHVAPKLLAPGGAMAREFDGADITSDDFGVCRRNHLQIHHIPCQAHLWLNLSSKAF